MKILLISTITLRRTCRKYNPNDYKLDDIIEKLMQLKIIKKSNICTVCSLEMKLVNRKDYKDKKCWRCKKISHINIITN